jgi:hypothetical protein
MAAGAGLVCFEAAELAWIGFQPLEAVFAAVGVIVLGLAWHLPRTQPRPGHRFGHGLHVRPSQADGQWPSAIGSLATAATGAGAMAWERPSSPRAGSGP